LDPRFVGSNPAESDGFLRAKIPKHAFLRRRIKQSAPCCNILRHVKDPLRYDRDTDRQNSAVFFTQFLPSSLPGFFAATWEENSGGWIGND
jgi:hypothetical protein